MSDFKKFPSIDAFHSIVWKLKKTFDMSEMPLVYYRGKIKIHGTNAGIRIGIDGTVTAQKRTSDIFAGEKDNAAFAHWVKSNEQYWSSLAVAQELVVYGEWAGPGLHKGVAVCDLPNKMFFIYAVMLDGDTVLIDPSLIKDIITGHDNFIPKDVHVLPWHTDVLEIDFALDSTIQESIDSINIIVDEIDKIDPYFNEQFGIIGPGEGLVYVPCSETGGFQTVSRGKYSAYMFKVKGESHMQVKQRKKVQIAPEVMTSIKNFAESFVTEARLKQSLHETMEDAPRMELMGDFLKWMGGDIKKESVAELEVSGLTWSQAAKHVNQLSRDWLVTQIRG